MNDDYEAILRAYEVSGGDPGLFKSSGTGGMLVKENRVLLSNEVDGLVINYKEIEKGVKADIVVKKGYRIENPVHLCFGVVPEEGVQEIIMQIFLEDDSYVKLLAHCTFPNAIKVRHIMDAKIDIGKRSFLEYEEVHYHGLRGGIEVISVTRAGINSEGRLRSSFILAKGRVGKLDVDYNVEIGEKAVAELVTKAYGKKEDKIRIKETSFLNGYGAKSIIKSRIIAIDRASSQVIGETYGNAPHTRGHVDCVEIVEGEARAESIPKIAVTDSSARITHEASIGRIDKKQLETLMARGLKEKEAIDVIIGGILK